MNRPLPGTDAPAGFTVLRTVDGTRLAKVIRQEGEGPIDILDYDKAFKFSAEPVAFLTLHDLYFRLAELQDDPRACAVRGAIAEGADPDEMRRIARSDRPDTPATLIDVPREVAFFDLDVEMTDEEDAAVSVVADPDAAIDFALALLPEAFRTCDLVYSFGSSAGIKPRKLSLHLAAMTDRPVLGADLKAIVERWNLEAGRPLFDGSIYGAQSIVYTSRPVFEGDAIDPLEGARIGIRNGTGRPLALPVIENASSSLQALRPAEIVGGEAPEGVALALVAELVGRASTEMTGGMKTRQEICVGVFTQLRDGRVRRELAVGTARALHRAANAPEVLKNHGGRTKPLGWFLEMLGSIYSTPPREPRQDVADAIAGASLPASPARLRSLLEAIREIRPRQPRSLGVAALDELLGGGLGEGEALGIGGGPGAFKTSLACSIVEAQAAHDTAVLVVAHDEDDRRVARKIGAQFGESWGELTSEFPSVLDRLEGKLAKRGGWVLVTRQAGGGTLEELVEEFEKIVPAGVRKVIVVDHLQSVSSSSWGDRDTELVQIEKVVRFLIDELKSKRNYVVIALSEVTKAALNPDSIKNAPLAAFAGTRKVASRFDVPLVLVPYGERRVGVLAPKNRFGKRGEILLEVDTDRWRFVSLDLATEERVRDRAIAEAERERQEEDDRIALERISRQLLPAKLLESEFVAAGVPSRLRAREARDRLVAAGVVEVVAGERTSPRGPGPSIYRVRGTV